MGALTRLALGNSTLVAALVAIVIVAGPLSLVSHPSREDPEITIRTAVVTASFPGMSPGRIEDLITRKIEEKVREMPEVESIRSTSRAGRATVRVELYDRYFDLAPIWQDLRNKMDDVRGELPSGTHGPSVNDRYGEVAMATIALTGEGFSLAELRETARSVRNRLYTVPGISKISLHGVEAERIYLEFDSVRLAQFGLNPQSLMSAVQDTNIISPGGRIEAGSASFTIEPTGNFERVSDIAEVIIGVPNNPGRVVYLRDLVEIRRAYVDPPQSPAFFNGEEAVIIEVQMIPHFDASRFGSELSARLSVLEQTLPLGYQLRHVTFQPWEIARAIEGVTSNLYQTVVIVLAVVMLFLGWRTGLIVGMMVPLTMLVALLVMRYTGIELERMSLAALIISLGLLVDNGIVVAEEAGRRMSFGQTGVDAAVGAGTNLALPLLSSTLTTMLAFMPLMLAENEAGEYTRSLSLVIGITLLASWVIAMTVTPVLCSWALKAPPAMDEATAYASGIYAGYRRLLGGVLAHRGLFLSGVVLLLAIAVWGMQFVPKLFFPASDRPQLQVYLDLPVGANTHGTIAATRRIADWLADPSRNPDVKSHVAYVASGGPRFYLGLNPIEPDPHRAFLIVNARSALDLERLAGRIRRFAADALPEARVQVKPMSMGGSEAGLVEYRVFGDDAATLAELSEQIQAILRSDEGVVNVKDDWENRLVKIVVRIDQARARRAGVTSESVAAALNATLSGVAITDYREGDTTIPVYLRAEAAERGSLDRLRTANVGAVDDVIVPLLQVADFEGRAEFAMIQRHDLQRVVTVSGKHRMKTAVELDASIAPALEALALPEGYRIEKGGELKSASEAQGALFANMPLAFAFIVLILIAQFNSLRKPLIILAVIPLTLIGVSAGLLLMPGAAVSFIGILGLLSLAGIIINNAIVLIDRIDVERENGTPLNEAIVTGSVKRLRPVVMTTLTTILGLSPLIVWRDILFYDLAVVVSGGLLIGTVLTLGVVPVLYSLAFPQK